MIRYVIELLKHVEGDTESIRIAKGKYSLPESLSETINAIKNDFKWHKKER